MNTRSIERHEDRANRRQCRDPRYPTRPETACNMVLFQSPGLVLAKMHTRYCTCANPAERPDVGHVTSPHVTASASRILSSSARSAAFVVAQGPDTFALSPVAPPTRTFLSTRVMAAPVIAPGAIAPLALPSMPHIFARCALPIALPKGAEPELDDLWITCVFRWGAPPIGPSPLCRRIAILGLPRFDALFNSHYVSP